MSREGCSKMPLEKPATPKRKRIRDEKGLFEGHFDHDPKVKIDEEFDAGSNQVQCGSLAWNSRQQLLPIPLSRVLNVPLFSTRV